MDQCDYRQNAPQSPHSDLAENLNWDMLGFITDWNWLEPQDNRITEEYVVYIYETICCRDLNETVDNMLTRGGFFLDELFEYQELNLSLQINDAQTAALNRCTAEGQGWEAWNDFPDYESHDQCDHWIDAWKPGFKSDE
jgi:hypothetical protein